MLFLKPVIQIKSYVFNHTVVSWVNNHETFSIVEGFGVRGFFPLIPTCYQCGLGTNNLKYLMKKNKLLKVKLTCWMHSWTSQQLNRSRGPCSSPASQSSCKRRCLLINMIKFQHFYSNQKLKMSFSASYASFIFLMVYI